MKTKRLSTRSKPAQASRASVTFPTVLYENLEAIAKSKKVSVAWVVRDAAEKYVADQQSHGDGAR
jgi:metal-responsive CopG/Arc/MetJ family transcriptional regulator